MCEHVSSCLTRGPSHQQTPHPPLLPIAGRQPTHLTISPATPNTLLPPPCSLFCLLLKPLEQQLDASVDHHPFTPQTHISSSEHPPRRRHRHHPHLGIMRELLESSWMRFGPAGRGSYDWVTGSPSTPEKQGHNWNELDLGEDRKSELVVYVVLPVVSVLLLALLVGLVYRQWSRSKLSLANIIALDLDDTESSAEFLSSLTRNAERHTSTSSDGSDGVFVMVYLPPPYEETLTKITRAASLSSSKDVESMKIEDLEAKLCPELKSSGQYV